VEPRIHIDIRHSSLFENYHPELATKFSTFFQLANSSFDIVIEAFDAEDGATVENSRSKSGDTEDWFLEWVWNTHHRPDAFDQNAFRNLILHECRIQGFLRAQISITAAEAIAAVGLTSAGINGADVFWVRFGIEWPIWRVFTNTNLICELQVVLSMLLRFLYNVAVIWSFQILAGTYDFLATSSYCAKRQILRVRLFWTAIFRKSRCQYRISDAAFSVMAGLARWSMVGTRFRIKWCLW